MTLTLTFAWWWIPTGITILGLIWALFIVDGGGGMLSSLANILALIPVLALSLLSFIIAGVFK